ncbi:hypothetical protein L227DRAFT_40674 [Lentinus tigrinus ALCF2SS1-6]|uniref:Uncharacterized protein n=1 Tax=Lentinus tigrinus ALCF2SS1-6 TaxID=1328759 RepID=A0A5C2RLG0_9APHY|nr:hypothetical protein L227DRAFT_40674 [Lentinus tigrinus ALCF2SS1-6]
MRLCPATLPPSASSLPRFFILRILVSLSLSPTLTPGIPALHSAGNLSPITIKLTQCGGFGARVGMQLTATSTEQACPDLAPWQVSSSTPRRSRWSQYPRSRMWTSIFLRDRAPSEDYAITTMTFGTCCLDLLAQLPGTRTVQNKPDASKAKLDALETCILVACLSATPRTPLPASPRLSQALSWAE